MRECIHEIIVDEGAITLIFLGITLSYYCGIPSRLRYTTKSHGIG